jgi:hypothetical protein
MALKCAKRSVDAFVALLRDQGRWEADARSSLKATFTAALA